MNTIAGYKKCSKCGELKPLDAFYRDGSRRGGRKSRCAACLCAASRARKASLAVGDGKTCTKCRHWKPLTAFHAAKKAKDGLKSWCGDCCSEQRALLRQRNKEAEEARAAGDVASDAGRIGYADVFPDGETDGSYDPDWRRRAACSGYDPELFFPVGYSPEAINQTHEAKQVCGSCPVRSSCLRWALDTNQQHGVSGGMSEDERRSLKRSVSRARARVRASA